MKKALEAYVRRLFAFRCKMTYFNNNDNDNYHNGIGLSITDKYLYMEAFSEAFAKEFDENHGEISSGYYKHKY